MRQTSPFPLPEQAPAQLTPGADAGILARITAGLARGSDLNAQLGGFLEHIVHIAGAQAGAVRVMHDDGRQMQLVASQGLPGDVLQAELAGQGDCGSCSVCGQAAVRHLPQWASDLATCTWRSESAPPDSSFVRMLAVPLHHRARLLGICNLFFEGPHEPTPEVLALLKSVGDLLGLALDNARLERENVQSVVLRERQAMAADVHDSLGQQLAFVKMRLPLLQDAMDAGNRAEAGRYFDEVRSAVTQAHSSLRGILAHMRSTMDPQGLAHALSVRAEAFRRSGVAFEFDNRLQGVALMPEQEMQVFHIVHEALSNITRHAAARHARLHLAAPAAGLVQVLVEDDGAGMPRLAPNTATHYGLAVMRERAQRLGGTLDVSARAGGGTQVRLTFPLQPRQTRPAQGIAGAGVH